jgi:hypothetical protein
LFFISISCTVYFLLSTIHFIREFHEPKILNGQRVLTIAFLNRCMCCFIVTSIVFHAWEVVLTSIHGIMSSDATGTCQRSLTLGTSQSEVIMYAGDFCRFCAVQGISLDNAGFPPLRPGFKPGSGHVGFCDGQNWRWGRFSPRTSVSPANIHSICFSTIIFTITRGWHNRPGVAAVPIVS